MTIQPAQIAIPVARKPRLTASQVKQDETRTKSEAADVGQIPPLLQAGANGEGTIPSARLGFARDALELRTPGIKGATDRPVSPE